MSPQTPPEPSPVSHKPRLSTIIIVIISIFVAGASITSFYRNRYTNPDASNIPSENSPIIQPTSTFTVTPGNYQNQNDNPNFDNWITYTNHQNNFFIQYPDTLRVTENEDDSVSFVFAGKTQQMNTEFYDGISVRFSLNSLDGRSLRSIVEEDKKEIDDVVETISEISETTIGDMEGYSYTVEGLGMYRKIYLAADTQRYFEITDFTTDPQNEGYDEVVRNMLNTLEIQL